MLRFLSVPFAALVFASGLVMAPLRPALAEALFTSPVPDWVEPVAVPPADPVVQAAVTDGVLTLLSDEQVRWDGEERQVFVRTVRLILDEAGLSAAGLVHLTFAPDSETVLLGRVTVTRGGQVQDMTETAMAQTLSPAESQTRGAPDGLLAAEVVVPDLQVGDVVEVAYLRRQLPVVAGINRAGMARLEQDVPVVLAQVVVNWPESWPIYISGWPARVGFVQETAPGIIRHTWTRQGHVPTPPAPLLPPGYSENTVIAYSAFPDWSAVTGALSGHYMGSYPLGAAWDVRLRAIQTENTGTEAKVIAALRAVQDELSYVARPLSSDSWLARLPAEATEAGTGDAKAKALLLRTMLDKMGIEAYVALTNRVQGHDLNGQKPAFEAFDHAMVKVIIDDVPYWMDPSARQEGGDLYSAAVPDFGYALPLAGEDQDQLELIDIGYASTSSSYIDESYNFTLLGVYVTVVTSHYGPAANAYRREHSNPDGASTFAGYEQLYAARFPGLRVLGPVEVTDDKITNQFTVTGRYLIPATALRAIDPFVLQTENPFGFLLDDVIVSGAAGRTAPLYLGELVSVLHRINLLNLPKPVAAPTGASVNSDALNFSFSGYESGPRDLTLEWSYNHYLRSVPPDAADQVLRDLAQIGGNTSFTFSLRP